jgi:hypothetical protein
MYMAIQLVLVSESVMDAGRQLLVAFALCATPHGHLNNTLLPSSKQLKDL